MKIRVRAFLIHLSISVAIGMIVMAVVFGVWYPPPLHEAVGVTGIFLMLLLVDVTIGPVITLIIYKPGKPSLKFDLAVIALLQLSALLYGVHTVFAGRPAFVVFARDRFEIARAPDLVPDSVDKALAEGNREGFVGWGRPKWVGAARSKDAKRNGEIVFSAALGGPDWPLYPELFVPLSQVKSEMLAHAKPMQELQALAKEKDSLNDWQDKNLRWLPMLGKAKHMVVLVDAVSGEVQTVLDIDPWQTPQP